MWNRVIIPFLQSSGPCSWPQKMAILTLCTGVGIRGLSMDRGHGLSGASDAEMSG